MSPRSALAMTLLLAVPAAWAQAPAVIAPHSAAVALPESTLGPDPAPAVAAPANTRSGREIYRLFREGLADPECPTSSSPRWRKHFAAAPSRLAREGDDTLALFGYVVDAVREAHLPTEYALIPFVESGYRPGARSPSGPAGLWQFIALTARNHKVPVRAGYDGRLSPVDSTRAAVRYLKTLHGMFAGDWRLAVMAYNAGEYRILGALRRGGQNARTARPESLPGLPGITHAYVQKLRALSCVFEQADDREEWLRALDRPVPLLVAQALPTGARDLDAWARAQGIDAGIVRRLNPAFAGGRIARVDGIRVLAPQAPVAIADASPETAKATGAVDVVALDQGALATRIENTSAPSVAMETADVDANVDAPATDAATLPARRSHTVSRGESLWIIARRYGVATSELMARNKLDSRARIRPGMVLQIDADPAAP